MDEFMKMNWKIEGPHELEHGPEFIPEDKISDSYVYLNFSQDFKVNTKNPRNSNKSQIKIPGKIKLKSTEISCLDKSEQDMCLKAIDMLQACKNAVNPYDQSCIQLYNNVQSKIVSEHSKYLKVAKEQYMKNLNKFKMRPNLNRYAEYVWKEKWNRRLDYAQLYKEIDMFSYSYDENEPSMEMSNVHNVLELGTLAKFMPPSLLTTYKLKIQSLPKQTNDLYNSKLTVSQDANCNAIIETSNVDIIISSSGLKRLLDFTNVNNGWTIPVVVKEINVTRDDGSTLKKNVCFIDKPMPKQNPDVEDFNKFCTKLLLKTSFCNEAAFSFPNNDTKVPKIKNENESVTSVKTEIDDSDVMKENVKTNNILHHNVSYRIWNLFPKDAQSELMKAKHTPHSVKVLVRCKLDACEASKTGALQPIMISPKVEYQLEYGGSIPTKTDLVNEWASLYFRPFSQLYRVRTHHNNCEVVMLESCNLNKINNEAQVHYEYKLHLGLGVLYKVFIELKKLTPGNYLLRHLPKHGPFMSLWEETNENTTNVYNLHSDCDVNNFKPTPKLERNWCPIDVKLILPIHRELRRMPGMFGPCKIGANKSIRNKGKFSKMKGNKKLPKKNNKTYINVDGEKL